MTTPGASHSQAKNIFAYSCMLSSPQFNVLLILSHWLQKILPIEHRHILCPCHRLNHFPSKCWPVKWLPPLSCFLQKDKGQVPIWPNGDGEQTCLNGLFYHINPTLNFQRVRSPLNTSDPIFQNFSTVYRSVSRSVTAQMRSCTSMPALVLG